MCVCVSDYIRKVCDVEIVIGINPLCAVTQHVGFDVTDASVRQPNMLGLGAYEALRPFINVL